MVLNYPPRLRGRRQYPTGWRISFAAEGRRPKEALQAACNAYAPAEEYRRMTRPFGAAGIYIVHEVAEPQKAGPPNLKMNLN